MERKKPDKMDYALAFNNYKNMDPYSLKGSQQQSENINDSLFCKYASSIIQVIAEDKLDVSNRINHDLLQKNTVFEQSELNYYDTSGNDHSQHTQNNYTNLGSKMKKKYPNKQLLAYNFSNFAIFTEKLNLIFRRQVKLAFDLIKSKTIIDLPQNKKELKRSSFHSGTTNTSQEDKLLKKQSKQQILQKRRLQQQESSHQIKGWIQFKLLILASNAFKQIKSIPKAKQISSSCKDSKYNNFTSFLPECEISISKNLSRELEGSLVYTADHNFQFTQKQVTLTTPDKFGYIDERKNSPNTEKLLNKIHRFDQQSFVQTYRPKYNTPIKLNHQKDVPIMLGRSRPIRLQNCNERRYLLVRTNIYELPLLSNQELRVDRQSTAQNSISQNEYLIQNEAEFICNQPSNIGLDFQSTNFIFTSLQQSKNSRNNCYSNNFTSNNNFSHIQSSSNIKSTEKLSKVTFPEIIKPSGKVESSHLRNDSNKNQYNLLSQPSLRSPEKIENVHKSNQLTKGNFNEIKGIQSVNIINNNNKKVRQEYGNPTNTYTIHEQPYVQKERVGIPQDFLKKQPKISLKVSPRMSIEQYNTQKPLLTERKGDTIINSQKAINNRYNLNNPYSNQYGVSEYNLVNNEAQKPILLDNNRKIQQIITNPNRLVPQERISQPILNPHNIYQINQNTIHRQPKITVGFNDPAQNIMRPPSHLKAQIIPRNVRMISPNHNIVQQRNQNDHPLFCTPKKDLSAKKVSFYSPQPKMSLHQGSQRYEKQIATQVQSPRNEYFSLQGSQQNQLRLVNINNNYYVSGPQTQQPNRNVFQQNNQQQQINRKKMMQGPSLGQHMQRINIFSNYSPLESELEYRSNHFSHTNSELSRPRSMNEKLHITLRRQK